MVCIKSSTIFSTLDSALIDVFALHSHGKREERQELYVKTINGDVLQDKRMMENIGNETENMRNNDSDWIERTTDNSSIVCMNRKEMD